MRAKSDGERDRRHGKREAESLHEVVLRQTKRLEIRNCRDDENAGSPRHGSCDSADQR